jgi:hypothetical protein
VGVANALAYYDTAAVKAVRRYILLNQGLDVKG